MRPLTIAVSFSVCIASLFAQADALARVAGGVTPIHSAPADPIGGSYGIWAAGADYEASFHDGVTFVPYLGRGYPVTRSVTWTTIAATLGGVDLLGPAGPRHSHAELSYEYSFANIVEAYDVRAEGLEQSFVINQKSAGELRIIGRFGGNLVPVTKGDEVAFTDPSGQELVSYGAAIAVDARGRRFTVDSLLEGDQLILTMTAANVAAAGPGFLGILPLAFGADVAWNLPLPGAMPAFTLHMQDVFLDPFDTMIYTSYRLSVPLVK